MTRKKLTRAELLRREAQFLSFEEAMVDIGSTEAWPSFANVLDALVTAAYRENLRAKREAER